MTIFASKFELSSKTQGNQEKTQGKLSKLKDFEGQNSRILPKLKFSEIPFPYVDAETAKKKPALPPNPAPSCSNQGCPIRKGKWKKKGEYNEFLHF